MIGILKRHEDKKQSLLKERGISEREAKNYILIGLAIPDIGIMACIRKSNHLLSEIKKDTLDFIKISTRDRIQDELIDITLSCNDSRKMVLSIGTGDTLLSKGIKDGQTLFVSYILYRNIKRDQVYWEPADLQELEKVRSCFHCIECEKV